MHSIPNMKMIKDNIEEVQNMGASYTRDGLIREVTLNYLENLNPAQPPSDIEGLKTDLIDGINDNISMYNACVYSKDRKFKSTATLPNSVIVEIMLYFRFVVNIHLNGGSYEPAVYCGSGEKEGLYTIEQEALRNAIMPYNWDMSEQDFKEIITKLRSRAPKLELTKDKDLIAVNNGIFDYRLKTLIPFSPKMVFLSKSSVDYNPKARNVIISNPDGTKWDVESWMQSLSGDPEIVELLWQLLGAVIRPNVPWNKSAWMYAASGNNGKGTLCELMRQLCGEESCESIKISQFSNDVFLDRLVQVSAVINDENQPGAYVEVADNLKCAITGDPITINRKYLSKLKFTFRGMIVQCFNEFPKLKDRTPSLLRRLLIIPMGNCFEGCERKYIKSDYIKRDDVLEYVMYKVLHMDYYELGVPQACRDALAEYQEFNDPVVEFWNEFKSEFVWDLLPYKFLYALYKAWHAKFYPSGKVLGKGSFHSDIRTAVRNDLGWEARKNPVTTGTKMDRGEPLIGEYNLADWQDHTYSGMDIDKKYRPCPLRTSYRGLVRTASAGGCGEKDDEEERG